jgi:REP element-mobilizing transposase RayT
MPYSRRVILNWQPGSYYHIYNRGARRLTIFRERTNFLFVISKIQKYSQNKEVRVIAYCLMPNHYHFLVRQDGIEPAGNLAQAVFNSYSKAYNKKYGHSGTLFEGRYRAKAIQTSEHLLHLCRYIHANPVKIGLVVKPEDWPYSNYHEWLEGRPGPFFDPVFLASQFSNSNEYRLFVQQYLASHDLPKIVRQEIEDIEK